MASLCDDNYFEIFKYLDYKMLSRVRLVSRYFNTLATNPVFWKYFCEKIYPNYRSTATAPKHEIKDDENQTFDFLGCFMERKKDDYKIVLIARRKTELDNVGITFREMKSGMGEFYYLCLSIPKKGFLNLCCFKQFENINNLCEEKFDVIKFGEIIYTFCAGYTKDACKLAWDESIDFCNSTCGNIDHDVIGQTCVCSCFAMEVTWGQECIKECCQCMAVSCITPPMACAGLDLKDGFGDEEHPINACLTGLKSLFLCETEFSDYTSVNWVFGICALVTLPISLISMCVYFLSIFAIIPFLVLWETAFHLSYIPMIITGISFLVAVVPLTGHTILKILAGKENESCLYSTFWNIFFLFSFVIFNGIYGVYMFYCIALEYWGGMVFYSVMTVLMVIAQIVIFVGIYRGEKEKDYAFHYLYSLCHQIQSFFTCLVLIAMPVAMIICGYVYGLGSLVLILLAPFSCGVLCMMTCCYFYGLRQAYVCGEAGMESIC